MNSKEACPWRRQNFQISSRHVRATRLVKNGPNGITAPINSLPTVSPSSSAVCFVAYLSRASVVFRVRFTRVERPLVGSSRNQIHPAVIGITPSSLTSLRVLSSHRSPRGGTTRLSRFPINSDRSSLFKTVSSLTFLSVRQHIYRRMMNVTPKTAFLGFPCAQFRHGRYARVHSTPSLNHQIRPLRRAKFSHSNRSSKPLMVADEDVLEQTKAREVTKGMIRPRHVSNFSIPFQDFIIRAWKRKDRMECAELISSVLEEFGLEWDPVVADRDVVDVENAYKNGEFWVVEDTRTAGIVGTGAFYEVPHRGNGAVEIRKLYLHKSVRGKGLGSFLLTALEQRALQLGYSRAVVETLSTMNEANRLYLSRGYKTSVGVEVDRCDTVFEKPLHLSQPAAVRDTLEVIDLTRGWTVAFASKDQMNRNRLLFRAVAVLVETGNEVVVHRRSYNKSSFPGKMAALVTGCIDWQEDPLTAAKREVQEEVGLSNLTFSTPFAPFVADGEGTGLRILFHPFVATGEFSEDHMVCDPREVDYVKLMTREQIIAEGIGGSLWQEFRRHGL